MKHSHTVQTVFGLLGSLIIIQGFLLLIPLIPVLIYGEYAMLKAFVIPSCLCLITGYFLHKYLRTGTVCFLQSLLVCGMAWIVLSLFGCIPFYIGAGSTFLDSFFETVSGFTTTGITLFTDIEILPKSLIFWRSFIQWLGGLGILTFFLAITFRSNHSYFQLFSAESHKIDSTRPTPSVYKTVNHIARVTKLLIDQTMVNIESPELRKVINFGNVDICIFDIPEDAQCIGQTIAEVVSQEDFPKKCTITCVYDELDNTFIIPRSDHVLKAKDRLFLCGLIGDIKEAVRCLD